MPPEVRATTRLSQACLIAGAVYGAAGVLLGAFGAHGLADVLDEYGLEIWDTAVLYQFVHAGALMVTGLLAREHPVPSLRLAGIGFGSGVVLFSGSLYLLALDGPRLLGPLTPLGGVCFVLGWLALAWSQRVARRT